MRKLSILAASALFAASVLLPMVAAQSFDPTLAAEIQSLQAAGIIDGGGIATLRLNDGINRVETLKVILKSHPATAASLSSAAAQMPPISLFSDVDQRTWYAPAVEVGFRSQLITGYPDGRFMPQAGVKTEEAAAMIARAFGGSSETAFATSAELPNQPGQWFSSAVSVINSSHAVMPGSRLAIGRYLTRGQLFDMVYRMRAARGITSAVPVQPASQLYQPGTAQQPGAAQVVQDGAALQYASAKEFAISIPSLGIVDLTITHPTDAFSQDGVLAPLQDGVGHLFSYPGEGEKIMVYGHSSGYPWDLSKYTKIFRGINKITVGARVYVTYKGKLFVYQVSDRKTIDAKDRTMFEPDNQGEQIILYTCWPPDSIAYRYIVIAVPVETIALR